MKDEIDILKKLEDLTAQLNHVFSKRGRHVFARYPLTFALLIFFTDILNLLIISS